MRSAGLPCCLSLPAAPEAPFCRQLLQFPAPQPAPPHQTHPAPPLQASAGSTAASRAAPRTAPRGWTRRGARSTPTPPSLPITGTARCAASASRHAATGEWHSCGGQPTQGLSVRLKPNALCMPSSHLHHHQPPSVPLPCRSIELHFRFPGGRAHRPCSARQRQAALLHCIYRVPSALLLPPCRRPSFLQARSCGRGTRPWLRRWRSSSCCWGQASGAASLRMRLRLTKLVLPESSCRTGRR